MSSDLTNKLSYTIFAETKPGLQSQGPRGEHSGLITEQELRRIAREPRWDRQQATFERWLARRRSAAAASPFLRQLKK